ncbi:WG repeat-containing protein [Chitinophaga agrisoli]|uniref:WG repeat-containing protein n=1 Tax=Chitinophaga agrisoli TaxID=2607653 RepID=A0A5B2VV34_9BACT|nr:WG repeat-containing protein [Chitinophaga agrisoli]KAA2242530.1 WG repeat-containing protein [Chitinophaga agrisoli]
MKNILSILRNEIEKYKNSLEVIIGLIAILFSISTLATQIFDSSYSIALICIALFFILQRAFTEMINAKKEAFGLFVPKYSPQKIKWAKVLRFFSGILLVFPLFLLIKIIIVKSTSHRVDEKNIGLLIARFTNEEDDDFSYKLFSVLDAELQDGDTINTMRVNKFINIGGVGYLDTIKNVFDDNLYKKGLLIFGKRSTTSPVFDCNIYLNGILNNKKIIHLQNPDVIKFSIDYQSQVVAEFILGLLYYNSNEFDVSKGKFQQVLEINQNENNRKLIGYSRLFIGHNLLCKKQFAEAGKEYKLGIKVDSMNGYLHYNLANVMLATGAMDDAYREYTIANKLNNKLLNPMEERYSNLRQPAKKVKLAYGTLNGDTSNIHQEKVMPINVPAKDFTVIVIGNKYGVVNLKGDTVIKCDYDYVEPKVYTFNGKKFFIVKSGSKYGAFNNNGMQAVPINHPSAERVLEVIKIIEEVGDPSNVSQF